MKITIDVEGYTEGKFLDYVADKVYEKVTGGYSGEDPLDAKLDKLLTEMVEAKVAELVEAGVKAKVEEIISAGIRTNGPYGRQDPKTVEQLIRETIEQQRDGRSYNDPKRTLPEKVIQEVVEAELRGKFGEALQQIQRDFKAQVDKVLADKLLAIVRSAS